MSSRSPYSIELASSDTRIADAIAATLAHWIGQTVVVDDVAYTITEKLGLGGQGVVYAAQKAGDADADYVVKILFRRQQTDLKRGVREMSVGTLTHPHLVRSFGIGELQHDNIGVVFERVRGLSLKDYIEASNAGPLSLSVVMAWGEQLASALSLIHQNGFVHRDIKPSNILIADSDGSVKLTDFGLCSDINADESLTRDGVAGTLHYMSPEHGVCEATPQSDLYSLGIVLHEAAYRRRINSITQIERTSTDRTHQEFARMIGCCMQPLTRDRYTSGEALREDLVAVAGGGVPLHARRLRRRQYRRRNLKVAAACCILVTICAALLWGMTTKPNTPDDATHFTPPSGRLLLGQTDAPPFRILPDREYPQLTSDLELQQMMLDFHTIIYHTPQPASETPDAEAVNEPISPPQTDFPKCPADF